MPRDPKHPNRLGAFWFGSNGGVGLVGGVILVALGQWWWGVVALALGAFAVREAWKRFKEGQYF
jgi:membrane protein implicated in regulation of membrane protease activity